MNFNRYLCQEFIEAEVGCTNPSQLGSFKDQIKSFKLENEKISALKNAIDSDAREVFYKSALSFLEALFSLKRGHSSWAIIKLYYSIFYSLRAYLLLSEYAPIKNGKGEIYFIKCEEGGVPIRISTKKIKGDHKTTIEAFSKFHPSHRLNTNTIDDLSIFDWARDCREFVNYRKPSFMEPDCGYDVIPTGLSGTSKIDNLIKSYLDDEYYTFCFLQEHSLLSTSSVLMSEVICKFRESGNKFLTRDRQFVLNKLVSKSGLKDSEVFSYLFSDDSDLMNFVN